MHLRRREVISPLNIRWSFRRVESLAGILQQLKIDWIGMRYRPPLLLSPPPAIHVNTYQSFENFERWTSRVKLHHDFLREPKDLDT